MHPSLRMPAEWMPHEATWLAWPHHEDDWPGKFAPVPWVFGEVVRHLADEEHVHILVQDEPAAPARQVLEALAIDPARVTLHAVPTDRVWTRDYAPLFVHDDAGRVRPVKWRFNAWAKYPNWERDEAAGRRIAAEQGGPIEPTWQSAPVVLEGGSIDVNGEGLLLTTEECLLSDTQQRNPGLGRADYERLFADYLGITRVIWLKRGIAGDDTHGHIDDLARFVNAHTVVTVVETDRGDTNYEPLQENLELLTAARDLHGKPLRVVTLPMPTPLYFEGQRLPASYANFYIANGRVLVPTFNDRHDRHALNTLAELFPEREVIGIHCVDLVLGLGTLHCMTQQQPAPRARP